MASDRFLTTLEDKKIVMATATGVARFSFMVQDSISYLDLKLCQNPSIPEYFIAAGDALMPRRLRNFVNTEEKCRKFFSPKRKLLYTLHLDLPKGRECSLKDDVPKSVCCFCTSSSPHIGEITLPLLFHEKKLSNFIEEALSINVPKLKILEWILKTPYTETPLLSSIDNQTASKFIDCFYPEAADSLLFDDFIFQFDLIEYMEDNEEPEILEYLLYHARRVGNISLDSELEIELISYNIYYQHYLNIGPILKYKSESMPCYLNYEDFVSALPSERPQLTEELLEEAAKSISIDRICRMMQIILMYHDSHESDCIEVASEALRLTWQSIPDTYVSFEEFKNVFEAAFQEEELIEMHRFYVRAIGESDVTVQPRSLQHLCRTVLRRRFEENDLWIPDAVSRSGLPQSLQSFLNLEKEFVV